MKFTSFCTLYAILVLVCAAKLSYSGFVQTKNTKFVVDGNEFRFNGFNSYWLMLVASDPNQRGRVTNAFTEAKAAGLTVCRTWAFSDGGANALQTSPGVYNENVFRGLDFVVSEAKRFGIRLILSLVNNYKDFGGRAQYVNWAKSAGAPVSNEDDFYTNGVVRGYFKNHANKVITRKNTITGVVYKDDATILAWELINEPRCQVDLSGRTVTGWLQEMASYIKSLDGNHMVENGLEGFYGPNKKQLNPGSFLVGTDFISSNQIKEIDFASLHAYVDQWLPAASNATQIAFLRSWLSSHYTDSSQTLRKPLLLGEFGISSKDPGFSVGARDSYMRIVYDDVYNFSQKGGFMGGLFWQLLPPGLSNFNDGYEIVLSQNPSTATVIRQQSQRMGG